MAASPYFSSPQSSFSAPPSTPLLGATGQFLHMTPAGGYGGLDMAASPYFSSPQSGFSAPPSTPLLAATGQFLHMTPGGGDGGLDMAASPYFSSPQSDFSSPRPTPLGDLARSYFTPHVVVVNRGEDVVTKIQSFSQNANKGVCILSASGDVCDVTLREPISGIGILHREPSAKLASRGEDVHDTRDMEQ